MLRTWFILIVLVSGAVFGDTPPQIPDPASNPFLKNEVFGCRVRVFGADRTKGPVIDAAATVGLERSALMHPDFNAASIGWGKMYTASSDADLKLEVLFELRSAQCHDGRYMQNFQIAPWLKRGKDYLYPNLQIIEGTFPPRSSSLLGEAPGEKTPLENCDKLVGFGWKQVKSAALELPSSPAYFETNSGDGVIQVRCDRELENVYQSDVVPEVK